MREAEGLSLAARVVAEQSAQGNIAQLTRRIYRAEHPNETRMLPDEQVDTAIQTAAIIFLAGIGNL